MTDNKVASLVLDLKNVRDRVARLEEERHPNHKVNQISSSKLVVEGQSPTDHVNAHPSILSQLSLNSFVQKSRRPKGDHSHSYNKTGSFVGCGQGLTMEGRQTVCAYLYDFIETDYKLLRNEITKGADADAYIYNALIVRVILGIQSSLDAVSQCCHDHFSIERVSSVEALRAGSEPPTHERHSQQCVGMEVTRGKNIYFHSYEFQHTELSRICALQETLQGLRYDGLSFNDLANRLKHHIPWIGLASENDLSRDIFDANGIGIVYGFILEIYTLSRRIIDIFMKKI